MNKMDSKKNLNLPTFPTTSVGSLPKPTELKKARKKYLDENLKLEKLQKLEKKYTKKWIKFQEKLGLDVLVDGEQNRGDMVAYFARNLEGFEFSGLVRSYGNRYYRKPVIVEELNWKESITAKRFNFVNSQTEKPLKAIVTGPYTLMDWSFNEYYESRSEACFELSKCIRKEVISLLNSGAKIIQIDEPALSSRPEEVTDFAIEAINNVLEDLKSYFCLHICYGDFENIFPEVLDIKVDNLDLEMKNNDYRILDYLKGFKIDKDISCGVIDVHSKEIEGVRQIKSRINKLSQKLDKEQIWIDPDCGLKTRNEEEAKEKLKNMVKAVEGARKEIEK